MGPRRQRSRMADLPHKYMKRSGSLDLFKCLWGRALAAQTTSEAHAATTSTGFARRSPSAKQTSGAAEVCGAPEAQLVDLCARMAAECLSRVMGKERCSWLGSIPSLDETVHAASTRKNQLQDAFKWHVKPARGNLCVQCERHTEIAVRRGVMSLY